VGESLLFFYNCLFGPPWKCQTIASILLSCVPHNQLVLNLCVKKYNHGPSPIVGPCTHCVHFSCRDSVWAGCVVPGVWDWSDQFGAPLWTIVCYAITCCPAQVVKDDHVQWGSIFELSHYNMDFGVGLWTTGFFSQAFVHYCSGLSSLSYLT